MPNYLPPFTLSNKTLSLVAQISESIGRLTVQQEQEKLLRLRKVNRMRTVQGSLAIEGSTLTQQQITAILDGKRVIAPPKEVQEAHNAISTYESLPQWQPENGTHLLAAHLLMMKGLVKDAGMYRQEGVGVMSGEQVVHMAPQATRVPKLMTDLLEWLESSDVHPLVASCVFHYEFEFIHPFSDGNGRMGRLWQTLILSKWHEVFINIPVESMVYQHQDNYYLAIRQSTQQTDSAPFIEFMLQMIYDAISEANNITSDDGLNDGLNEGLKLSKLDKDILIFIQQDRYKTNAQLAEKCGKSQSTIERRVKFLKDAGLITRIGAKKTGYWQVNSPV
ncbi:MULTISPECIES: Fic family protein [unclassified Pseudoalteromonas]|uniref:Fic family protein n=1 Tax=unclassified Pseudoalteromonas TaxID=194690 RepID=UPI00390C9D8C|nr:Fic family protein [Ningiella sp. W23]